MVPPSPQAIEELENLMRAAVNEPVGHDLFLEAWQQVGTNPRSALIIGMAAAQIGFKQCVGRLVPDAEWLADNVPSPPLPKMVSEYLPLLPAKLKIAGRVLKPPRSIRTELHNGVKARNGTAHAGSESPKTEDLEKLLLAVRDLLYLLDLYCGFDWAIEHIRDEVKEEMIEEFALDRPITLTR